MGVLAWRLPCRLHRVRHKEDVPARASSERCLLALTRRLHVQPPSDNALGGAAMFHYTWGTVFKDSFGKKIWEFDKRTYTDEIIQREVKIQD